MVWCSPELYHNYERISRLDWLTILHGKYMNIESRTLKAIFLRNICSAQLSSINLLCSPFHVCTPEVEGSPMQIFFPAANNLCSMTVWCMRLFMLLLLIKVDIILHLTCLCCPFLTNMFVHQERQEIRGRCSCSTSCKECITLGYAFSSFLYVPAFNNKVRKANDFQTLIYQLHYVCCMLYIFSYLFISVQLFLYMIIELSCWKFSTIIVLVILKCWTISTETIFWLFNDSLHHITFFPQNDIIV